MSEEEEDKESGGLQGTNRRRYVTGVAGLAVPSTMVGCVV